MTMTFVVTNSQALVLVDLSQQLRDLVPDAQVHAFSSPEEALPTLARLDSLTGAITGAPLSELRGSCFVAEVDRLGGWLVCVSDRHREEISGQGWHQLRVPFSTETAARLFGGLLDRAPRRSAS